MVPDTFYSSASRLRLNCRAPGRRFFIVMTDPLERCEAAANCFFKRPEACN
jgi:hypothetical protein